MNKKDPTCTVVVSSCDAYQDAWRPFFTLFFKYWPDCPFSIVLVTNELRYEDKRVTTIEVKEDRKWASNLREVLSYIETPYILYMQEDYFLNKPIGTHVLNAFLDFCQREDVAYLRLTTHPAPDIQHPRNPQVGILSQDAPYRASLQAAFWKVADLRALLVDGESGWDMERFGTVRSQAMGSRFLCSRETIVSYITSTGIKKGKWLQDAVRLFRREGMNVDLSRRPVESGTEYILRRLRSMPGIGHFMKVIRKISRGN